MEEYEGFFLCPDYNLMCSGTVLRNDMYDRVDKKSETKEESYIYDYTIKTSQNIRKARTANPEKEQNYELSEDGICPKYCVLCRLNGINKECIKCNDTYARTEKGKNIICLSLEELRNGYYYSKKTSLYHECIENCNLCSNGTICENCKLGFTNINNKNCSGEIKNCEEYNEDDISTCKKCKLNFAFIKDDRTNCINLTLLKDYYSKDGGISYYSCDEITNCNQCIYNNNLNKLECKKCANGYILLNKINDKCFSKNNVTDKDKTFYYINDTHAISCIQAINNCEKCKNEKECISCVPDAYFLNDNKNSCYKNVEIDKYRYYLSEDKTNYLSCRSLKYHTIANCRNCTDSHNCLLCSDYYTFVEGNKSICINKHSLAEKYYQDPNDYTNYISCANIDINCIKCTPSGECKECKSGYGLFKLFIINICFPLKEKLDNFNSYIYLLGLELYNEFQLKAYMLFDLDFPDDWYFYVPVEYMQNYGRRNLEEKKKEN